MVTNVSEPKFTVIIPVFNKERYLRRSLRSVLEQTFSDFELIVVDDGSTDSSGEIVASVRDPRLQLIRQQNKGVSAARNRGITEARGEWLTFLDADDEYLPKFLDRVRLCTETFPEAGAIYASVRWMKGQAQVSSVKTSAGGPRKLENYFRFITHEKGPEIHISGVAIRRSAFHQAGCFPVGVEVGEDSDLWVRLGWTTAIAHIPEFLSIYHMDAGDSQWQRHWEDEPFWMGTYREWLAAGRIPPHLVKSSAAYEQKFLLERNLARIQRGNRSRARKALWREVSWLAAPLALAFKTLFYAYAPLALIRLWRKARSVKIQSAS